MVALSGEAGGGPVHGAVSGEALEDHFGADGVDQGGRLKIVRASRSMFERMARKKDLSTLAAFLSGPTRLQISIGRCRLVHTDTTS
jgi:hypothetical protein